MRSRRCVRQASSTVWKARQRSMSLKPRSTVTSTVSGWAGGSDGLGELGLAGRPTPVSPTHKGPGGLTGASELDQLQIMPAGPFDGQEVVGVAGVGGLAVRVGRRWAGTRRRPSRPDRGSTRPQPGLAMPRRLPREGPECAHGDHGGQAEDQGGEPARAAAVPTASEQPFSPALPTGPPPGRPPAPVPRLVFSGLSQVGRNGVAGEFSFGESLGGRSVSGRGLFCPHSPASVSEGDSPAQGPTPPPAPLRRPGAPDGRRG